LSPSRISARLKKSSPISRASSYFMCRNSVPVHPGSNRF
jgi:hypothetical protein